MRNQTNGLTDQRLDQLINFFNHIQMHLKCSGHDINSCIFKKALRSKTNAPMDKHICFLIEIGDSTIDEIEVSSKQQQPKNFEFLFPVTRHCSLASFTPVMPPTLSSFWRTRKLHEEKKIQIFCIMPYPERVKTSQNV